VTAVDPQRLRLRAQKPGVTTVKLTDQVWFSNGKDEFRGDVVIYNVRDERVKINPGGQGRVRGIIRPEGKTSVSPPAPAQPGLGLRGRRPP